MATQELVEFNLYAYQTNSVLLYVRQQVEIELKANLILSFISFIKRILVFDLEL